MLLAVAAFPCCAAAAPVVVLGPHSRAAVRNDPFLTRSALSPAPLSRAAASQPRARRPPAGPPGQVVAMLASRQARSRIARRRHPRPRRRHPPQITVVSTLAALYRSHQIDQPAYRGYVADFNGALATEKRLRGTRRTELQSVTETMHQIAATHQLTASRLPALFATLSANVQWWSHGPLLSSGQRVEFAGSQLVWEYYPGAGIQLQVLGSFGKADGLYTGGPAHYPAMEQLLSEIIPLAARRGGGLTWEYYFPFDGGAPPWTSAMSQATGLEALTRAYEATGNSSYLQVATQALPVFSVRPPTGVAVATGRGTRFVQYTFTPQTKIINAFLQTLIGLHDFARVSGNQTAARLFAAGNVEAMDEVPGFDTGAWSLYEPGIEDDLSYHELVTGFLSQLCAQVSAPVYCTTARHFKAYLTTPPALAQLTMRATARKALVLRFRLSKVSHVGLVVSQGRHAVFQTSASFAHGVQGFAVPAIKRPGTYAVALAATDLAGNFGRITGTLHVSRKRGQGS